MTAPRLALTTHTIRLRSETDFDGWRDAARGLVLAGVEPGEVAWEIARGQETTNFASTSNMDAGDRAFSVPREFVERARAVACHSDVERFDLLYRLLFRLRSQPRLLEIASDPDLRRFEAMEKAVRRDCHKMRAFVRFRQIGEEPDVRYVAWFEPDHHILERNAPFFARRFTGMRWTIVTPEASAAWDGEALRFGPGGNRSAVPDEDAAEELWLTYYRNIFNPARLKVKAMQAEMPKKYWRNLPEAPLIPDLVADAERRARTMVEAAPTEPPAMHAGVRQRHWSAAVEPARNLGGLDGLRAEAAACQRCPLFRDATQTVFGEGSATASLMFIGEQPGDQEDLAGKPFVGPAGKVFDAALADADLDRDDAYVTNAVKHFKFVPRGRRRIHAKPNAGEVQACRWWLDRELALVRPRLLVALGGTAAQAVLGRAVAITRERGTVVEDRAGRPVFLTVHPSYILRIPDPEAQAAERTRFVNDLKSVKAWLGSVGGMR